MSLSNSHNPYGRADDYRMFSWRGVLPLPYKKKMKPPTGFTGHNAPYPTADQVKDWKEDGKKHNICLRLAGVDKEHEIVGIDVDHYRKGDKDKKGGEQLQELEDRLGPLPATWISSSRTDGVSGIRYFRVPRGFAFRGQVAKDIECISKGYRYAIVWPSLHEDTGDTYWWFPPGVLPDEAGREVWGGASEVAGDLPDARSLPELPEAWFLYLTQNRMRSESQDRIDMDSSVDEVYQWADDTFHSRSGVIGDVAEDEPCPRVREKLDKHKKLVEDEATSHDKIVNAHYNIFRLAAEGHLGWNKAINELEAHFCDVTVERGKRALSEVQGEVFRSRINGLRKVKAQCDERVKIGAAPVEGRCDQLGGVCGAAAVPPPSDPVVRVGRRPTPPADSYDQNDDGNAAYLTDMFSSDGAGADIDPNFRFIEGLGWIVWFDDEESGGRWEVDPDGTAIMRRMWHRVKDEQVIFAMNERANADMQMNAFMAGGGGPQGGTGTAAQPAALKAALASAKKWEEWAQRSGNNRQAEAAIEAAKSLRPKTRVDINDLDSNPLLLGVANGVVELGNDEIRLRKARKEDLITLNTGVRYEEPSEIAKKNWNEYLDTFLPDEELRKVVQIALGHAIVGGNKQKIMIVFRGQPHTGKSTMIDGIEAALGDYAVTVNHSVFQSHKLNPVLGRALSKRIIICSEFDENDNLSASMIKRMTGEDKMSVELKNSNKMIERHPQFVPLLATNEVPTIRGADKALQDRLFVIPFDTVPKRFRREFRDIVRTVCGPAVLKWLIEGYQEFCRTKEIPVPEIIRQETEEFVSELDEVATFAAECLVQHSDMRKSVDWKDYRDWCVKREDMYAAFKKWWEGNGHNIYQIPSSHALTKRLRALGYPGSQGNKNTRIGKEIGRWWYGVKIRTKIPNVIPLHGISSVISANPSDQD